ncbi:MAG: PAS domain S-box protein [Pontiella sp.]
MKDPENEPQNQSSDNTQSVETKRLRILWLLGVSLALAGIWGAKESGQRADMRMRRELMRQAISIAKAVPVNEAMSLSFTREDLNRPVYQRLCNTLKAYTQISGIESIYTMALRQNGKLVFGPEGLDPDDEDASLPGEIYLQPSREDFEIFETGRPVTMGPITDEYGTFVSASAPVFDPHTGKVILTIGLDIEASEWKSKIRHARMLPIPIVLIPILILIMGGTLMKLRHKLSPKIRVRYLRHVEAATCAIIMLLLTGATAYLFYDTEDAARKESFLTMALIKANILSNDMDRQHNNLQVLADFFKSSTFVSRAEFNSFCANMMTHRSVIRSSWFQETSAAEIPGLEQKFRDDGLTGITIQPFAEESGGAEGLVFPAVYITPKAEHQEHLLGYNPRRDPFCRSAMDEAIRSGFATSCRIADPAASKLFHIFLPASSETQKGLVAFTISPDNLLEVLTHQNITGRDGLKTSLLEIAAGERPKILSGFEETSTNHSKNDSTRKLQIVIPLFSFGKTYALLLAPEAQWYAENPMLNWKIALFSGLALTCLLTNLVGTLVNRPLLLERKVRQRTKELWDSELRYMRVFSTAGDAMFLLDQASGAILDSNDAASEMYGFSHDEFQQLKNSDLSAEPEKPGNAIRQELRVAPIRYHRKKDGTVFPVEINANFYDQGERRVSVVSIRDITERKEAELELTRLSTAIQHSPASVVITDLSGTIQYINPAFEHITGYSSTEIIGRNIRLLSSGKHGKLFYKNLWKIIQSGSVWEARITNKRKDGTLYTEEASISPVKDPDGNITNYVAVKRDITTELVREEELRRAQKMDAVGQLAGGIAHDFNNILQGIQGFSELLENSLEKGSQEHANAHEIKKAAKQAAELTRQLLTFSRKQPALIENINANAVAVDSETLLNMLTGERIEVVLELDPDLPTILADHGQLTQVILNLAMNARDAMTGEGRLTITTECDELDDKDAAHIAEANPGRHVVLSVTDTGCGITADIRQRLFDPFFTTKEVGSGTGLGLAVVYGIVKQHHGWITVYSETGKGTCFRVYLPTDARKDNNPDQRQSPAETSANILVAEDNPEAAV